MKRELVLENPRPDGYHLMLEFFGCDTAKKIDSLPFLRQAIKAAVQKAGLTNLGSRFHQFHPHGVTGFTLLSQSHISFHTWPEYGYLVLDIFTCGPEEQAQTGSRCACSNALAPATSGAKWSARATAIRNKSRRRQPATSSSGRCRRVIDVSGVNAIILIFEVMAMTWGGPGTISVSRQPKAVSREP
jgi:S-adenosylmethionine decarboxylase proenzyme